MTLDEPRSGEPVLRYRFGKVTLDVRDQRLLIQGRGRVLPRRSFDLLLALCRSPRRALSREELHEALWPGGQIASDEALTQTLFRVRGVLGADAEKITTLRGIGVRLDADVTCETELPETPAPSQPSVAAPATLATAAAKARATPRRRAWLAATMLLALVTSAAVAWFAGMPRAMVDDGYGIAPTDVHAAKADTLPLLAEAIRHDNFGDRWRAHALLEALHEGDSRTPWPALLLSLWSVGAANPAEADRWLALARERIEPLQDTYLNAMLRYAEAEQAAPVEDIVHRAGAVLDLRADAWRLRLARAHLRAYQGMREAALSEIQRIQVRELGVRRLESALADRASYGDVAGAQAVLDSLPRTT
ncbi:winged helix-turn-helix domain-containing protein, partial [Dokdonella sp.]|uniref:winged helix-turn-helix domain-containing protein n=1 Tax=Dokdonella sp. TaxID=2291710 RepID=UPI00263901A3